ncbi:hypothetical protein LOZ80_30050 [Paenibacillus sp. HWE-109]|uniref:hypothetical protein n=1 Tax=Paenibacillus sp. HWE-109 TaxID=1306526 RepID=UPI001EDCB66D|nr:hypothetical protein [Paenibacillus sp. HWE-109]UKS25764.1 hypothetical protein LOZ80_30050 [Paenibacillus sp. HWE-109]
MIEVLLGLIAFILIIVNIKYKMKTSIQITITIGILLLLVFLSFSYIFSKKHNLSYWDYRDYKKQALNYSKEYDPLHTYEFINIVNQGCTIMIGCTIIVKLESSSTGDTLNVLFNNGRLVQFARPK